MIRIISVGDIMPGGLLSGCDTPSINEDVSHLLMSGDIRCGTLECAFGEKPTFDEAKVADRGNVIYAKDNDVRRLNELHINVVSLANNHFFDLGETGANHTIDLLDREKILHCGAGKNLKEAATPAVVEIRGKKIAFLGFCDTDYKHVYWCTYATENSPGVNPMYEDYVVNLIQANAIMFDYVVVLAHWGTEHTFYPNLSTDRMARLMLKAGAIAVLGSHPHRIQPVINTRKGSIAYSMGNFLFPERLIAPPKVTYYPEHPIDYSSLPVTDEYPLVDCITLKTLPFLARVGMIVTTMIDNRFVKSMCVLSYLNENNSIEFLDEKRSRELFKGINRLRLSLKWNQYKNYRRASYYINVLISKLKMRKN